MKTRTMTRTQAELLLAAVIIARSTSYVLTKVGLQDMGKFTLLAVRFLLAFAFLAVLYRVENGRAVFTILTREPAEQIRFIHDRMPVILTSDAKQDWLNLDCDAAQTLAQAYENVAFCAVDVSC